MTHPQHKIWELLRKHFPDERADFIVSIVAPYLAPQNVWVYQGKETKVFATEEAAQAWFEENDPEGVAFEYEVIT